MDSSLTTAQYALIDLARFALMALVAPAAAWLRGRRLLRRKMDDATAAEELWAWYVARGKLARLAFGIWMGSAVLWLPGAWLPEPGAPAFVTLLFASWLGMTFALALVDYRIEKTLKRLTCGFRQFLRLRMAFLLFYGWYGLLVALTVAMPFLYEYRPSPGWYAEFVALAAALAALATIYPWAGRRIMGAAGAPPEALREAVERTAREERLPVPRIGVFSDRGTRSLLAFAIPTLAGRPAILISDHLLVALTPEEAAAIALHELGHCSRRETRVRLLNAWGGLAGLLVTIPAATTLWPGNGAFVILGLGVLWFLFAQAMRFQAYETQADLFGARHGGADAMVSALTRIHTLSLLPRRFSPESEQRLSHPGLARRIAAIRRAFPAAPAPDSAPAAPPDLPPIAAEDARRRPVTLELRNDNLIVRQGADVGRAFLPDNDESARNGRPTLSAEAPAAGERAAAGFGGGRTSSGRNARPTCQGEPELVIPAGRILAADIRRKRKAFRLRVQWADAEKELVYRIADSDRNNARDLIARMDGHFLPPETACRFSLASGAREMFRKSALIGGLLAPFGGLPLLIVALVNRRRRNPELFGGYIVAAAGAAVSALLWASLTTHWWLPLGAAFLCVWAGAAGLPLLQTHLAPAQAGKPPRRWVSRAFWVALGLIVAGVIVAVAQLFAIGLALRATGIEHADARFFGVLGSFAPWTAAALLASGPWRPRPSLARLLLFIFCVALGLGLAGAVCLMS